MYYPDPNLPDVGKTDPGVGLLIALLTGALFWGSIAYLVFR
jgi:hypothetical protein